MMIPKLAGVTTTNNRYATRFISGTQVSSVNTDNQDAKIYNIGETAIDNLPSDHDCLYFLAAGCHQTLIKSCQLGSPTNLDNTTNTGIQWTGKVSYKIQPGIDLRESMVCYGISAAQQDVLEGFINGTIPIQGNTGSTINFETP